MKLTRALIINTLTLALTFVITSTDAKTNGKDDKIKAKKVSFFTQKLNLNSDEATIFWPVYNEYQEKKDDLFDQRKNIYTEFSKSLGGMSNREVNESLDKLTTIAKDEALLLETYIAKFKDILPEKKVAKLFVVEEEYKLFLLQQIRNTAINK